MIKAREVKWHRVFPRQIVVPNGITMKSNLPGFKQFDPHGMVYLGTLSTTQGIQFVVEAMNTLKERIHDVNLTIIGMGALEKDIRTYISQFHLQKYVHLRGYVADPYEADRLVSTSAIGVAMYVPKTGFVSYTEPGKIKRYLSCSVPVIMTDVSPLASVIEAEKCGIKCPYRQSTFVEKVVSFLGNLPKQHLYRKHALRYAEKYDWDHLFNKSFQYLRNSL
jgi:glycosyltransferase involved in cell wall biosynthesis